MAEEASFVGEIDSMLKLRERVAQSKTRMLHNEWEAEVYDRVQEEVAGKVNARKVRDISKRNAALMQRFLDVSNAKEPYGVFREIIIPAEYDPLHAHEERRLTFDPQTKRDPCKLELRQHAPVPGDLRKTKLPWNAGSELAARGGVVPRLAVKTWDKLEATPYGRLGKVIPDPNAPVYKLTNNVLQNNHIIERGKDLVSAELPRGKRCFP